MGKRETSDIGEETRKVGSDSEVQEDLKWPVKDAVMLF